MFGARGEHETAQLRDAVHDTLDSVRSLPRMLAMSLVLLLDVVARRRADPGGDSMLALLLEQRDEHGSPPTDRQLRDQLVALLADGHDTSAAALAWAFERLSFERLARHPAVHARLGRGRPRLPRRGSQGGPAWAPRPRDRSAPAARAGADRGADAARRRPRRRPERWLEGPLPSPMAWIPFGGGERRCAGAPFAKMEMREVLRAVADLTIRPVRPEPDCARRRALVVTPPPRRRGACRLTVLLSPVNISRADDVEAIAA